jgi:hypothetical protein
MNLLNTNALLVNLLAIDANKQQLHAQTVSKIVNILSYLIKIAQINVPQGLQEFNKFVSLAKILAKHVKIKLHNVCPVTKKGLRNFYLHSNAMSHAQ